MEMAHANFKGNCWRLRWTPDGPLKTHFSIFMSCVTPQRNLTLGSPVGMGAGKKQGCVPDTQQPGCQQLKNTFFLPKPNLNPQTVYSMSWNDVWHLLKQEDLSQVFYQLRCREKYILQVPEHYSLRKTNKNPSKLASTEQTGNSNEHTRLHTEYRRENTRGLQIATADAVHDITARESPKLAEISLLSLKLLPSCKQNKEVISHQWETVLLFSHFLQQKIKRLTYPSVHFQIPQQHLVPHSPALETHPNSLLTSPTAKKKNL